MNDVAVEPEVFNHYVYVMRAIPTGYIKIGRTVNVDGRKRSLRAGGGIDLEVIRTYGYNASEDCAMVEKYFHIAYKKFKSDRHTSSEWFAPAVLETLPLGRPNPKRVMHWLMRYYPQFQAHIRMIQSPRDGKWIAVNTRPYK